MPSSIPQSPGYHHVPSSSTAQYEKHDDGADDGNDRNGGGGVPKDPPPVRRVPLSLSSPQQQRSPSSSSLMSCSSFLGDEDEEPTPGDRAKRLWAASLFAACTVLLFADQNLMAPNLTTIGRDFGFDGEERDKKLGGDIALAFWVLGAPASLVVGCLGDSCDRSRLFALTVGIGEGACLATYFASTYSQLYVCRAVTGFSIGGALPLIYSVVSDLFVADQRHGVSAMVGIGSGLGISLGQGVAGYLGPSFGWRLPFLVISVPALLCAVLVYCTVEDPERGGMEQAVRKHRRQQQRERNNQDVEMVLLESRATCAESDDKAASSEVAAATTTAGEAEADLLDPIIGWDTAASNHRCDMREHWGTFKILVSTPTVILAMLQGAPGCVPWGIVNTYLNDFLSENRGMSVEVRVGPKG